MRARKRRLDLGRYRPPREWPEASEAHSLDDAMLVAAAAVRMSLKNLLIVRALRHQLDYSADVLHAAVREEFENLALEKESDARRVASHIETARGRIGKATHLSDYRDADIKSLTKRRRVLELLCDELRRLAADEVRADELIAQAQQDALDEVLGGAPRSAPELTRADDPEEWSARRALLLEDLERLSDRSR